MARAPDARTEQAKAMYLQGKKLIEISAALDIPEGTVRSWKNRYGWEGNANATLQKPKRNVAKKCSAKEKVVAEEVRQVIENPDLTDKQRLFCLHYVRCFNATKAAIKAGYSYDTAMEQGYQLLHKTSVRDEIARLKQNRLNRELLDEHDIFQKYMDIAFADITDYVEFKQEDVQVMAMYGPVYEKDDRGNKIPVTKKVNTVKFKDSATVDGSIIAEVKQGRDGASIKLADRMKALDWLSAHMGMATEEQRARIDQARANTERLRRDTAPDEDEGVEVINDAPAG